MKNWAAKALKEMRETAAPVRLVADLRGPVFGINNGDTIELSPVEDQPSYFWTIPEWPSEPTTTLVLVRWSDGRARLAVVATRKGPHTLGQRLRFEDSRGRGAWIGAKHQLAVVRRVEANRQG